MSTTNEPKDDQQLSRMRDLRHLIADIRHAGESNPLSLDDELLLKDLYMELEDHRKERVRKAQRKYAKGNGLEKNRKRARDWWRENNVVLNPRCL